MMMHELIEEHIRQRQREAVWKANWDRQWAIARAIGRISNWGTLLLGTVGHLVALVWLPDTWAQRGVWLAMGSCILASYLAGERMDALLRRLDAEIHRMLRETEDWMRRAEQCSAPSTHHTSTASQSGGWPRSS